MRLAWDGMARKIASLQKAVLHPEGPEHAHRPQKEPLKTADFGEHCIGKLRDNGATTMAADVELAAAGNTTSDEYSCTNFATVRNTSSTSGSHDGRRRDGTNITTCAVTCVDGDGVMIAS